MEEYKNLNESIPLYITSNLEDPFKKISLVFNNVTNSYKFYWFWAIVEIINEKDSLKISYDELSMKMFDLVWYPLTYYKLSFGKQDSFKLIADRIQSKESSITSNAGDPTVSKQLEDSPSYFKVIKQVNSLVKYVPFRFLSPFFSMHLRGLADSKKNKKIEELANNKSNNSVPYKFTESGIIINLNWAHFFKNYQRIIIDFIHRNLISFLQKHNPNTIGLSSKLIKPEKRNLLKQRKLFRDYLVYNKGLKCLYTGALMKDVESIDHFIPWSYVVHDHIWNLLPVTVSGNSSKSNRIPDFDTYFNSYVGLQFDLAKFVFHKYNRGEFVETYTSFFKNEHLIEEEAFANSFQDVFTPLKLNAINLGFESNWIYES